MDSGVTIAPLFSANFSLVEMTKKKNGPIPCLIAGIGAWGRYFHNWQELNSLFKGIKLCDGELSGPKPHLVPANERRRLPLPARLAIESSWQATQAAGVDLENLTSVFVSGLGDTDLTDYMCKVLASEHKELSPTKFHNSVHNAPAGYWTISSKNMASATSVAGYEHSTSLALLEALIQLRSENNPVLVTLYDAPVSDILEPLLLNKEPFSFSLLLVPEGQNFEGVKLEVSVEDGVETGWAPLLTQDNYLQTLHKYNPSAKILGFVEHYICRDRVDNDLLMPLSTATALKLRIY